MAKSKKKSSRGGRKSTAKKGRKTPAKRRRRVTMDDSGPAGPPH